MRREYAIKQLRRGQKEQLIDDTALNWPGGGSSATQS
jgi:predicted GIY-YIG superfamily endonuclease